MPITIDRPPELRATGWAARMTTAVSLPSMARSMRNQVAAGNRRSACAGTSIKSMTTSVHTPDCTTRLSDLIARSITRSTNVPGPLTARTPGSHAGSMATAVFDTAWPRTHSRRGSTMPQAAAVGGSKRSKVSIRATVSPRRVAAASAAHTNPVRPDEAGPTTSDTCPRGKPPASPRSRASTSSGDNRVFAQAFGNGRGEGTVEFSLSEQGFYGGADGHISPQFA